MKVISSLWQVTELSVTAGTPDPRMEEEGSVASGSGGVQGAAYGHDEFERHTREGVRVLDEMSDEEDDRATDDLGGSMSLTQGCFNCSTRANPHFF